MAQTDTRPAAPQGLASEPDFVELPETSSGSEQTPNQRSRVTQVESSAAKPATQRKKRVRVPLVVTEEATEELTWQQWIAKQFTGDEGAGLGISLVLHLMLIAILAIPIIRHVQSGPIFSAVLTESGDDEFILSEPLDTELSSPELDGGIEQFQLPDLLADESAPITDALFRESAAGEGDGIGAGDVAAGMQRFVPDNAVVAGSFSAWTTPTFGHPDRGEYYARRFGEPDPEAGDSPRPGQPYYITIQIRVPEGRRRFPIRDLTGVIIGTDGYEQRLPEHTYVLDQNGRPTRARTTVPVVDDVVQIMVFVPGARELVKDTIEISSKLLNEEQEMEILFEAPPLRPSD